MNKNFKSFNSDILQSVSSLNLLNLNETKSTPIKFNEEDVSFTNNSSQMSQDKTYFFDEIDKDVLTHQSKNKEMIQSDMG